MINEFENFLTSIFNELTPSKTKDAMWYALVQGGKRFRPQLLWSIAGEFNSQLNDKLLAAAIIEMLHAYSLVHDDLPAMDNDVLRRGLPTVHVAFGEATAILAGDGLLTLALQLCSKLSTAEMTVAMLKLCGDMAGANGMILGQQLDMNNKCDTLDDLIRLHELKTGCLFAAALAGGAIITKRENLITSLVEIGYRLGLCYQIQDDLLDLEANPEERGKQSSDQQNGKITITEFMTLAQAKQYCMKLFNQLHQMVDKLDLQSPALSDLIRQIESRKK